MSYHKRNKKQDKTFIEIIFVGFFKALWWLIKLPFGGRKKGKKISYEDRNEILKKRLEIEKLMESHSEIELRHALLESDKLTDHILKISGFHGETFADRLKNARESIPADVYQNIWDGHKIRNQVVHENDAKFSNDELRRAILKLIQFIKIWQI